MVPISVPSGAVGCHGVLCPSQRLSTPRPSPALGCTHPCCRGGLHGAAESAPTGGERGQVCKKKKKKDTSICSCVFASGLQGSITHPPRGQEGWDTPPARCDISALCPCPWVDPHPGWGDSAPRLFGSLQQPPPGTWFCLAPKPHHEPPRERGGMSPPPRAGWATCCRFLHA